MSLKNACLAATCLTLTLVVFELNYVCRGVAIPKGLTLTLVVFEFDGMTAREQPLSMFNLNIGCI